MVLEKLLSMFAFLKKTLRRWIQLINFAADFFGHWILFPLTQVRVSFQKGRYLFQTIGRYPPSIALHLFLLSIIGNPLGVLFGFGLFFKLAPFLMARLAVALLFIILAYKVDRLKAFVPETDMLYLLLLKEKTPPSPK